MFGFGNKKITANQVREPVILHFVPLKDFYSKRMKSHYVAGMEYCLRKGNNKLESQIQKWSKLDPPLINIID